MVETFTIPTWEKEAVDKAIATAAITADLDREIKVLSDKMREDPDNETMIRKEAGHLRNIVKVGLPMALQDLLVSLSFLISGITTYSSSYFTGLNQGTASLAIAAVKGFLGPLAMIFLLPALMESKSTGLWLTALAAELLTLLVVVGCFIWWKRKPADGYLPEPPDPAEL